MPRPPSSEPLTRCDLNLYAADVDFLKRAIGSGWTGWIREVVREKIKAQPRTKTIGEMMDE